MNLNQLRIFYESARLLNYSKAAQRLFISQPAVSSQMKQLENVLKVKLFSKQNRGLALTEPGRILFGYAEKIFAFEAEAERALDEIREIRKGTLLIGTTKTYARYFMSNYISVFHALYPGVSIHLSEGSSTEMIQSLIQIKTELAIVAITPTQGNIHSRPFGREEILLVCSPLHPIARAASLSLKELSTIPLIMREEGSGTRQVVTEVFKSKNLSPTILYEASNVEFIKDLLIKGEGLSFMVRPAVHDELVRGLLKEIRIEGITLTMEARILFLDEDHLSRAAKAFLEIVGKGPGEVFYSRSSPGIEDSGVSDSHNVRGLRYEKERI